MTRYADHAIFGEQPARHAHADGIERKMDAVGASRNCDIDAIVYDEQCAVARADLAQAERELEELAREEILFAQLQCDIPRLRGSERSFTSRNEVAISYDSPIGDKIQFEADLCPNPQGYPMRPVSGLDAVA